MTTLNSVTLDIEIKDNRYMTQVQVPAMFSNSKVALYLEDGVIVLERLPGMLFKYPCSLDCTIDQPITSFTAAGKPTNILKRFYLENVTESVVIYKPQEKGIFEISALPAINFFNIQFVVDDSVFSLYKATTFGEESYNFNFNGLTGKAFSIKLHIKLTLL